MSFPHEAMQDRVVVQVPPLERVTEGGLLLTNVSKKLPTEGIVVAAGPGRTTSEGVLLPMPVALGDKIVFPAGTGKPVQHNGEDFYILKQDEIIAIVGE